VEKLHLRNPKKYDYSDEANTIPVRIKFYCVSEGPTEESYFWGIKNNRKQLKIRNDVRIEVIPKQEGQETLSHPMQLVKACLRAMGHVNEGGKDIPETEWKKCCQWDEFDPKEDRVCVVFDRDYRGLEKHLDEVFHLCEDHGIRIVMSNPNFELWLLMHFPNIQQYDKEKLLNNKKNLGHKVYTEASVHKRYLEILLSTKANGYKKGCRLKFDKYVHRVDLAVEQAALYCEEPRSLISDLGTSMGKLIQDMRS